MWASGNQVWNGNIGSFTAKPKNRKKKMIGNGQIASWICVCDSSIMSKVPAENCAPGVFRWHGIANGPRYFKVEEFDHKRFRFLRKPGARVFRPDTDRYKDVLHKREPIEPEAEHPKYDLPVEDAFLMEFKAPYQHYADQLFYEAVGSLNDKQACEAEFAERDLALGRLLYQAAHTENKPRKRWWHKWL